MDLAEPIPMETGEPMSRNKVASGIAKSMLIRSLAALMFLASIIVLAANLPFRYAFLWVMIGLIASVVIFATMFYLVVRRVREAREQREAILRRQQPGALIVHTEWNAALQEPFIREGAAPRNLDYRGFEVDLTVDEAGIQLWIGAREPYLIGSLVWKQIVLIESTSVHAVIGSHQVSALRLGVKDSDTFLPVIELIYRGNNVDEVCASLTSLWGFPPR